MEKIYTEFIDWIVTSNGDPWKLETEEDVENFVNGRSYRFIGSQLPDDQDEIWDIMAKLDIPTEADAEWHLDMVEFEDGERAYMAIEEAFYHLHKHNG